jgi:polysaccharide biosynthesis transport protein
MAQEQTSSPGFSLAPDDIIFILLRHKWKICIFFILGLIAAGGVWKTQRPLHSARAKLLIRYVAETRVSSGSPPNPEVMLRPEGPRNSVTSSEVELLSSFDTVLGAAGRVEPSRILAGFGGGDNLQAAAAVLKRYLTVEPAMGANAVINLSLEHPDPQVAVTALKAIIEEYLRKHLEVHSALGASETLQRQVDQLRVDLSDTEELLRSEKKKAGVISLDGAKTEYTTQLSRLRTDLFSAEAELAERQAELSQFQKGHSPVALKDTRDDAAVTKALATAATNVVTADATSTRETLAAFSILSDKLRRLKGQEVDALASFRPDGQTVTKIRREISETEEALKALGIDPSLLKTAEPRTPGLNASPREAFDIDSAQARISALEARVARLKTQLDGVNEQATRLDSFENNILRLQRKKEVEEEKLRYSEANLERARFDQAIDASKLNNISVIQEPVRSGHDMTKLHKLMAGLFGGFVAIGLAIAFATELFLDRSFKRSKEVEKTLRVPLIATIPFFGASRPSRKLLKGPNNNNGDGALDQANGTARHEEQPWDESDPMLPYYEALRDRVVMSYGNDLHKPKIVGVTSFNKGAGTTRISTGLAAALSRDVERNVLFIALEKGKVAVSAFAKGRPLADISADAGETPDQTKLFVARNLHSLAESGHNVAGASIVQSFCDLLPKLKVCDYDYIIFDLPPVSQTSGSMRLVTQMERTLVVLEAEKSSKDVASAGLKALNVEKGKLFAVLNKSGPALAEPV